MSILRNYLDCVAFIFCESHKGPRAIGTGFFIEKFADFGGVAVRSIYFVTARHLIEQAGQKLGSSRITIRVNQLGGGTADIVVPVDRFIQSRIDGSVDVTVTRLMEISDTYRIVPLPLWGNYFSDGIRIGEGTATATIGLFHRVIGKNSNVPIVRTGTIASLPGEPIQTGYGDAKMYIIESRSLGGLSGAPVLAILPVWQNPRATTEIVDDPFGDMFGQSIGPRIKTRVDMKNVYKLIGITHGHWDALLSSENGKTHEIKRSDLERINEGLSLVTPVEALDALLEEEHAQEELSRYADEYLKRIRSSD
jgi:hypothetical protein